MHHNWEDRDRHKDTYKIEWEPFFFYFEGISIPILFYTVEFLLLMLFPFSQFILSLLDVVTLHEQKEFISATHYIFFVQLERTLTTFS